MKFKKVVIISLTMLMAASLGISGCGKKVENKEKSDSVTIKWLSQGPGKDSWEGLTKSILEEYEKDTGVHVEAEFYSFNDLFEVLETKSASQSADFDVASVDVTYVAKYGTSGYLEPLDKYFTDEEKAQWDKASYEAGIWDDVMYAAPENTSTQVLYYNETLLKEAGIELPENGVENRLTYEKIADLAEQVQKKLDPDGSKGMIGFDFQQVSRVYQMNMLANSMGGKNIGEDGFTIDGVINDESWVKAMTWYQDLVKKGIASKGYDADQLGEQFYSGNMVFMIGGTWTPSGMKCDDQIGCTYAPCFEGYEDKVATSTGSWYFGVNSKSENKEAAADFVKWFTLGKGNDLWLEANGDVPSRLEKQKEIEEDPEVREDMKIAAYEAANTAVPRAVTPVFGEYSTALDQAWEDIRNGADVKGTLKSAIEQYNSAIASYEK